MWRSAFPTAVACIAAARAPTERGKVFWRLGVGSRSSQWVDLLFRSSFEPLEVSPGKHVPLSALDSPQRLGPGNREADVWRSPRKRATRSLIGSSCLNQQPKRTL